MGDLHETEGTAITVSYWIKGGTSQVAYFGTVSKGTDAGASSSWYLYGSNGYNRLVNYIVNTGSTTKAISTYGMLDNTWHHVAMTWDGSGDGFIRGYVDGVLNGTSTQLTGTIKNTAIPVQIGRYNSAGRFFKGSIDQVLIYDKALNSTEIQKLYVAGVDSVTGEYVGSVKNLSGTSGRNFTYIGWNSYNGSGDVSIAVRAGDTYPITNTWSDRYYQNFTLNKTYNEFDYLQYKTYIQRSDFTDNPYLDLVDVNYTYATSESYRDFLYDYNPNNLNISFYSNTSIATGYNFEAGKTRVRNELFTDQLYVGANTETIDNTDFTMSGDDTFILGDLGIEGDVYSDGEYYEGNNKVCILNESNKGYLHIGDTDFRYANNGDLFFNGSARGKKGLTVNADNYGVSLMGLNSGSATNLSSLGGTATFTVKGVAGNYFAVICDTTNPFVSGNEDMFLTIISSTPDYSGGTGLINNVINSSCIEISIASAGMRPLVDASSMSYVVYKHPLFAVLDRGSIHAHIGKNKEAQFYIYTPQGNGFHNIYIDDTAGADHHQALTVNQDGHNYKGVVGLNVLTYSSVPVDNKLGINALLEIDGTDVNNSEGRFIDISLIGQSENSHVDAIHIDPNIEHIIHMGSSETIDQAWVKNGTNFDNATEDFTSEDKDITIFENDNDFIYIGNDANFTTISISLDTGSSHNLGLEYYYCNGTAGWTVLPGVADSTNGFKVSGTITFSNPSDRGKCNISVDGESMGSTNYTYIGIKRTTNNIVTAPIENIFGISGGSIFFLLQKDLIQLSKNVSLLSCTASEAGGIMYGDLGNGVTKHYGCDGSSWNALY